MHGSFIVTIDDTASLLLRDYALTWSTIIWSPVARIITLLLIYDSKSAVNFLFFSSFNPRFESWVVDCSLVWIMINKALDLDDDQQYLFDCFWLRILFLIENMDLYHFIICVRFWWFEIYHYLILLTSGPIILMGKLMCGMILIQYYKFRVNVMCIWFQLCSKSEVECVAPKIKIIGEMTPKICLNSLRISLIRDLRWKNVMPSIN